MSSERERTLAHLHLPSQQPVQQLLAERTRRHTDHLVKSAAKMTLICEPSAQSDFHQRQLGLRQELLRARQPASHHIRMRRRSDGSREGTGEMRGGNLQNCSKSLSSQFGIHMHVDVFDYMPQHPGWQSQRLLRFRRNGLGAQDDVETWTRMNQ